MLRDGEMRNPISAHKKFRVGNPINPKCRQYKSCHFLKTYCEPGMVVVYILSHLIQLIVLKVGIIIFDKNEEIIYQRGKEICPKSHM